MSTDDKTQRSKATAGINKASLAELIAKTPGAQTREQITGRIKTRRQKRLSEKPQTLASEDQLVKPEPLPIIGKPDEYAKDFFQRLKAKEKAKQKPPKRSKPKLVLDNEMPKPADKE